MASEKVESILEERQQIYGDAEFGHTQVGKMFSAILTSWLGQEIPPLPAHIVMLMNVAAKTQRASLPCGMKHEDTYLDIQGYGELARKVVTKKEETVTSTTSPACRVCGKNSFLSQRSIDRVANGYPCVECTANYPRNITP